MDYVPEDPEEAPETQLDFRFKDIGEFVAERDPKRIGVNYSERLPLYDGLSYTDHSLLVKALGDKYANRMVSAEYLISDYLSRRVMNEIILYGEFGIKTAENLDREFAKVVPGITKLSGLEGIVFLRDPDGNEFSKSDPDDYVLQRGDLFAIGSGAGNRIMRVEFAGKGYVLREGETELSPEVKKIWEHGIKTREILRNNIRAGRTAGETLEIIKRKLEKAGYYYNPVDAYDKNADPEKTQVHLDLHAKGKRMLAPRISPLGPDWERDMKIPLLHTFAFEYMIHMPVPKWGRGKHLYIVFADVAVVTERGVEFPSPPDQGIRIIR